MQKTGYLKQVKSGISLSSIKTLSQAVRHKIRSSTGFFISRTFHYATFVDKSGLPAVLL
jgi:hypothetical protein